MELQLSGVENRDNKQRISRGYEKIGTQAGFSANSSGSSGKPVAAEMSAPCVSCDLHPRIGALAGESRGFLLPLIVAELLIWVFAYLLLGLDLDIAGMPAFAPEAMAPLALSPAGVADVGCGCGVWHQLFPNMGSNRLVVLIVVVSRSCLAAVLALPVLLSGLPVVAREQQRSTVAPQLLACGGGGSGAYRKPPRPGARQVGGHGASSPAPSVAPTAPATNSTNSNS
jgi:hypothetical protein